MLKQIEFIRLREHMILVILVSTSGMVQNKVLHVERDLKQADLDRYAAYINTFLGDLTILQLKERILQDLKEEKILFDKLFYQALYLGSDGLVSDEDADLIIGGRMNIIEQSDFDGMDGMKRLMRAFEEKHILIGLLDKSAKARGIHIFIGAENEHADISNCSVVTSRFGKTGKPVGTLGVIGPKRMDYSKVIPIVEYTAKMATLALETT